MIPYSAVVHQSDDGKCQVKFLDLSMQRSQLHPKEFDTKEEAQSALESMGWRLMNGTTGTFRPRSQTTTGLDQLVSVPRGSDAIVENTRVTLLECEDMRISMQLSGVEHAQLGECYGFYYRAHKLLVEDGDVAHPIPVTFLSPVFEFVTMGLFKVECIGYYLTETSALRAAETLFRQLISMLGEENYIKLIRERIQGVHCYVDWARRAAGVPHDDA